MSVLRAEHLFKRYQRRMVVDDVSLEIGSEEVVGLLGPNGAGKTTSFYMILGLVTPNQGKIFLDDQEITGLKIHERARMGIGYLPQEPSIFRGLSVADNLMAVLELTSLSRRERQQRLEELLVEFRLTHLRDSMGSALSGGERRRAEIARVLAINPKFILLDEPFAGIDPISIVDIKKVINHLSNLHVGILITDHNVRDTLDICSRAYIVGSGKIIATGNAEQILADSTVRKVYLGTEFDM